MASAIIQDSWIHKLLVIDMELRDIEYFVVVAEHKNIGRAAEALGLSQPALSKSLRRLEQSVRAKVVKRTTKGIELTAVGNALLAKAERLRLTIDDISREAADLGDGRAGHLRIGTGATLAQHAVAAACDALMKQAPKISMTISVGDNKTMLASLRAGSLDLVVTSIRAPHYDDLVEERLYDEPFVIFAATNHRLARRKHLTLADLTQERWAMGTVNGSTERKLHQLFGDAGLGSPNITVETPLLSLRHQLVASSDLLTFNSMRSAKYAASRFRLAVLPVKDLTYVRPVGVIYRKDGYLSPTALKYIELLKESANSTADV